MRRRLALLGLALLLIAGCDSGGEPTDDLTRGRFEATMSGDVAGELTGRAAYSITEDSGTARDSLVQVTMTSGTQSLSVFFEGFPDETTYTFDLDAPADEFPTGPTVIYIALGQDTPLFSTRATVTVTHADADAGQLDAAFEADLGDTFGDGEVAARVTGTFRADAFDLRIPAAVRQAHRSARASR